MLGREGELEAAGRLIGEPSSRLLGDLRRMIIKDQVDRRMGWIGRVEKLEKLDELAAAVAILDQAVNLTGQQIDAGHQDDRAVSLVLMLAHISRPWKGERSQCVDVHFCVDLGCLGAAVPQQLANLTE